MSYFNWPVFFSQRASSSCGILISYLGKISFVLNKQKSDEVGRILIRDVRLDADQYILINLYSANTETKQCKIFNELKSLLKSFGINHNKKIIFAGDFNILFTSKREARAGKPIPKRKSVIKLDDIKESLDICNI